MRKADQIIMLALQKVGCRLHSCFTSCVLTSTVPGAGHCAADVQPLGATALVCHLRQWTCAFCVVLVRQTQLTGLKSWVQLCILSSVSSSMLTGTGY